MGYEYNVGPSMRGMVSVELNLGPPIELSVIYFKFTLKSASIKIKFKNLSLKELAITRVKFKNLLPYWIDIHLKRLRLWSSTPPLMGSMRWALRGNPDSHTTMAHIYKFKS